MAKNEVPIEFKEAPRIGHVSELMVAAQRLATSNCAYVVPVTVESESGPITTQDRKVAALVWALNNNRRLRGAWISTPPERRHQTPEGDYGMHCNPFEPDFQTTPDYLRWHHTPIGTTTGVFAQMGPEYMKRRGYADARLTELLDDGLTDPRYADRTSFVRAEVGPEESVVFRFDDGTAEQPHPYLHGFTTTSSYRIADLYDIYRVA
jgi:hypothetical protein